MGSINQPLPIQLDGSPEKSIDSDWNGTETIIKDVLAQVSNNNASSITRQTGFFHLGLDSISAIKVVGLLKKRGIKLPVSELIKAHTVEKMAQVAQQVEQQTQSGDRRAAVESKQQRLLSAKALEAYGIAVEDVEEILEATAGQSYMLETWSQSEGRLFYATFWYTVSGASSLTMESAIKRLAERVPMLRTTFVHMRSSSSHKIIQVAIKAGAKHKYAMPWSHKIEPVKDKQLLTLKIHHALYDAVSLQVTVSELRRLCMVLDCQETLNTNFGSFVSTTTARSDEDAVHTRKPFWTTYLDSSAGGWTGMGGRGTFSAPRISHFVPSLLPLLPNSTLKHKLKEAGLSIQSLFFAAYARIYASLLPLLRQSEATATVVVEEVILGIYLSNRSLDIDGLPQLAAPTFNIVPLKINTNPATTSLLDSARQVQNDLSAISKAEHCGVSLAEVYEWTGVRCDCFVNFMRLPQDEDDDENDNELDTEDDGRSQEDSQDGNSEVRSDTRGATTGVKITHATPEMRREIAHVQEELKAPAPSPFWNNTSHPYKSSARWCLPSIDIEARVDEACQLGVGVFAPEDMIEMKIVERMLEDLKGLLLGFVEE